MEKEWAPSFVHESGHALMALIQGVLCHGIAFEKHPDGGMFCALLRHAAPEQRCKKDYLILAAGVAAEKLVYPGRDSEGAGADLRDFNSSSAPAFDEAVREAYEILLGHKRKLKRLASMLKSKARAVDFDLDRLPEAGMDGSKFRYLILLSKEELENAFQRP
ncbi:MAG: M50 family metallopeptidase [Acidobacteriia bacterium]|nr:M50 family metallopeptidase [Terriglobia bacterium]